jgi:hypothetical protein
MDARKDFPSTDIVLQTHMGRASHIKTDVYRHIMWYIVDTKSGSSIMPLDIDKVKEIIELNKQNQTPEVTPIEIDTPVVVEQHDFTNVVGQESLTRFDTKKKRKNNKKRKGKRFKKNEK